MTVKLTAMAALLAGLVGTFVALCRVSPVAVLRVYGAVYVDLVRNTPLTLVVFFCVFGLYNALAWQVPWTDNSIHQQTFWWATIGLGLYHGAFVAEAWRSGVNTVPVGQAEAARALGLGFGQGLRDVVAPQALRGAITPLGNTLIALTKNSTVAATVGVAEAAYVMKGMIEFRPDLLGATFTLMAVGFVMLTLPTGFCVSLLSRRLAVSR